jgi:hypothetical protein
VVLEQTDRLFSCDYCRVRLYLTTEDCFRYLLPPSSNLKEEIIYAPYWRIKGIRFDCTGTEIKHRIIDANLQGTEFSFLPYSLGLRPQTLKLRFASPETAGRFLPVRLSHKKALSPHSAPSHLTGAVSSTAPLFHRAFVGETVNLVYSPMFLQDHALYDAVLEKQICPLSEKDLQAVLSPESSMKWRTRFIPTLCPHCGWDLEGEKDSLVLFCRNCRSALASSRKGLTPIDFALSAEEDGCVYMPFWRMKVETAGGPELLSYADMARMMNLPKALKKEWYKQSLYFWTPAFKIRPGLFLRLAKILIITQPAIKLPRSLPASWDLYPVTLHVREAKESLKVLLAHLTSAKNTVFPKLPEMRMEVKKFLLVYFPFRIRGSELVQQDFPLTIPHSSLRFGRKL